MKITISKLTSADVDSVDELMKRHTSTIGFLPRIVLEDHATKEWILGATTQDGTLAGYLLYAAYPDRFRIVHLCVAEAFRNQGLARRLLDAIKARTTTQKVVKLSCRNDFPAHHMWPKLGFVPIAERSGRSKAGHPLTLWRLVLATDDQLALFRANVSDETLDVIIDSQVFFDFDEPDSDKAQPSKALLADFFVDSIAIWVTDELLTEISRNSSASRRAEARTRASQFLELRYDPLLLDSLTESLKQILPSSSASQISDINHLAKAAASDVSIFVTRDQDLLKKSDQICDLVNLQLLSPTELIMRLRELSEVTSNVPDCVSGLGLEWRTLSSSDLSDFPFKIFLEQGERLGQFREKLDYFLVEPVHELEVLWSRKKPVALRVLSYSSPRVLTVSLGRVANSQDSALYGRFLISDIIYKATRKNLEMIKFDTATLPISLMQGLSEMGFTKSGSDFVRFCFPRYLDHMEALSEIARVFPEHVEEYRSMTHSDLERSCSPLLSDLDQGYFLVPIRQGYALSLFDRQQASRDLFGGLQEILLRWSNVYYRAGNFHKMIKAPGRILWYVSGTGGAVVAVSHLDAVIVDTPKELLRKFKNYGVFQWTDLYKICGDDISAKLMALRFSHTFPLRRRVLLDEIWRVFDEDGVGRSLQAPRKLPTKTFRKLFQLGYVARP